MLKVELVYVTEARSTLHLILDLKPGTTVAAALTSSGIYKVHPETKGMPVGIYAKQVSLDTVLKEGDRIEVYRPLAMDPKENRRQKARLRQ